MSARRLVSAYTPSLRAALTVADPDDDAELCAAAAALPAELQELLDGMMLCERIGPSWRARIEAEGEPLWRAALLLPEAEPSPGATLDPRHYAGACRINPALRSRRPFGELLPRTEAQAAFPPSDSRWDAIVVAALLESEPVPLTREGGVRKDSRQRTLSRLGEDLHRWELAFGVARACGLLRPVAGKMQGFPEVRPRPLVDPLAALDSTRVPAARVLLRLVDEAWLDLPATAALLEKRSEVPPLAGAAEDLWRLRVLDGCPSHEGLRAVRRAQPSPNLPPGFLITPDLDVLVGANELEPTDYGRLCRLAPFVDGSRVHRHRLGREGLLADLAAGHEDAAEFLARFSRTGLPGSARQTLAGWSRSARRISLLTGATVVEHPDGRLEIGEGAGRSIDYSADPPARFEVDGDTLRVPAGMDPLTVRAALARVADNEGFDGRSWIFRPRFQALPEGAVDGLRRFGAVPGAVEAAALGGHAEVEEALVLRLPARVMEALRRDLAVSSALSRPISATESVVLRQDLPRLRERLAQIGIELR